MKAKKSLGQNFLKDEIILQKIANSIETKNNDLIIEIGPGTGSLTKYLTKKNSYLICYEIDTTLNKYLDKYSNINTTIIYDDFLSRDITKDLIKINYDNLYIIANIPYYITTPIIKKIIHLPKLKELTLLVQKEVAKRLSAKPQNKEYGSLTVYLNYYFDITYLYSVPNTSFEPIPKVDSAVIHLKKRTLNIQVNNEELLFKLITDSFKHKRKTLKNNLTNYNWSKIKEVLIKNNLSEQVRAEELSLQIFIEISNNLE